jgi:hypothetical protein
MNDEEGARPRERGRAVVMMLYDKLMQYPPHSLSPSPLGFDPNDVVEPCACGANLGGVT